MTEREMLCLQFLDDRMDADVHQIGRYVRSNLYDPRSGGSNYQSIGSAICGRLRKKGFVVPMADLQAWRITKAGREALKNC